MKRLRFVSICILTLVTFNLAVSWHSSTRAQSTGTQFDPKAHYNKAEHLVPMRDETKLFTILYTPKEAAERYPIMLDRTPYSAGPYGPDAFRSGLGPSEAMAREGYIFVYQDVRGRWMSEGEFVDDRPVKPNKTGTEFDEPSDTYDTIDWLLKNVPNNNGRVGMWGISYPGFYTSMGIIDAHPALKAASPQAPVGDWFIGDDWHHHGAFFLVDAFNFYSGGMGLYRPKPTPMAPPPFAHGTPDGYQFFLEMGPLPNADKKYFHGEHGFWNDLMKHGSYDQFWKERRVMPHLKNIKPAIMVVTGWFDAEDLYGSMNTYQAIEKQNPGAYNILVTGPWCHGCWSAPNYEGLGNINFGGKVSRYYQENIELPFFNHYLKDKGELKLPEASMFLTGVNEWRSYDQWPPKGLRQESLYFHPGGKLAFERPRAQAGAFDEYISDPARPVPYVPQITSRRGFTTYMDEDQRFAGMRPDVLVYKTDPLTEDVTIAGPIQANLFVSTTGTDADWVVKVIDVLPDDTPNPQPNPQNIQMGGYEMMLRGDVMRGKFRDSYEQPAPFVSGKPTKVSFTLQDIHHRFQKGHRIMIQVQSSWFPLVDRNPQKFVDIYKASAADFHKATHRVYHSGQLSSGIRVGILKAQ